jgi:hypothetical protein
LHLDYSGTCGYGTESSLNLEYANSEAWASAYHAVAAGAAVVAALGLLALFKRRQ